MAIPVNHPQRFILNYELHARPSEAIHVPERASYLALATDPSTRTKEYERIVELCTRYGVPAPAADLNHFQIDLGPFRLKWERRTECASYTFFRPGDYEQPFVEPASAAVPQEWLESLPGQVLVAAHLALRKAKKMPDFDELAAYFDGNALVGSYVGSGGALAVGDFRIHADGFSRFLIENISLTPHQTGRTVQRLVEIETYLMRALLTFPLARATMPILAEADEELAKLTAELATVKSEEEALLLNRLTQLAATIESTVSSTHYRISAARAYHALVERRISDLRETRIEGLSTFGEFTRRRLVPAMNTCNAVAELQESLSERVSRASELLRTRVDVALQRQNQVILSTMAKRGKLQLRLQETVEGLSVAAITYYAVGLIGYAAKAAKAGGMAVNPDIVSGVAIPFVAILTALGVRHIRRSVQRATA